MTAVGNKKGEKYYYEKGCKIWRKLSGQCGTVSRRLETFIRSEESRRYVVPSAPGKRFSGDTKVTDLLYACYDRAAQGKEFGGIFQEIKERYYEIIRGLDLKLSLEEEFAQIEADFRAQAGTDLRQLPEVSFYTENYGSVSWI